MLWLIAASALAAWSSLTVVKAGNVPVWLLAIVAGELGHYLALVALVVAVLAGCAARRRRDPWLGLAAGLALVATGLFARPIVMVGGVQEETAGAFAHAWGTPESERELIRRLELGRLLVPWPVARGPVEAHVFAHAGTSDALTLDFYRARVAGAAPLVVVIHGGGWDGGDRTQFAGFNHELAERGYAVAAISYRLAPEHRWPAQSEDVQMAVRWLRARAEQLAIDPERMVLFGRSAGGQIATAVGYGLRDPAIRGVIASYAPHDMRFVWSIAREDDVLNSVRLMRQYLGGPPEGERGALYDSASAQLMVEAGVTPPTLLLHGTQDELVWVEHSRRLHRRLTEAGVPSVVVELPWGTHAFDAYRHGPGGQLSAAAVFQFLDHVTQP